MDCIVSTESAGIPWGNDVANYFDLPFAYVRKKAKTYGTKKLVEGYIQKGAKVLNIDDLATTLRSIKRAVEGVKAEGAEVIGTEIVFNRKQYTRDDLKELNAPLYWLIDIFEFVEIGVRKGKLGREVASQILAYHTNEAKYAKKAIEENLDFVLKHPRRREILAGYEEAYLKTKDENFASIVKILKRSL